MKRPLRTRSVVGVQPAFFAPARSSVEKVWGREKGGSPRVACGALNVEKSCYAVLFRQASKKPAGTMNTVTTTETANPPASAIASGA
jgi:hypothetical protein